jgi:hypothetical protein
MKRLILILGVVALLASVSHASVIIDCGRSPATVDGYNDPNLPGWINNNARYSYGYVDTTVFGPFLQWGSGAWILDQGTNCEDTAGNETSIMLTCKGIPSTGNNYGTGLTDGSVPEYTMKDTVREGLGCSASDGGYMSSLRLNDVGVGTYTLKCLVGGTNDPWTTYGGTITVAGTSYTYDGAVDSPYKIYTWTGLSGGTIQIDWQCAAGTGGTGDYFPLAVVELIPEPATLSLLVLGGLVAIRRRR